MRNGILITFALLGSLIVGCTKVESTVDSLSYGDGQISFTTAADWTKGSSVSSISDVDQLQVYSYAIDGTNGLEWVTAESSDLAPYFTDNLATPFTLTQSSSGSWSYDVGEKYWPVDGRELTFFVHYPASDLTHSTDEETGLPQFTYTLDPLSRNNDDLVLDIQRDLTDDGSAVNFELQHALTKLSLQVRLEGNFNSDEIINTSSGGSESYSVNGIVFYNLYENATLNIDFADDGSRVISWDVDDANSIELSSTQGQTLKSVDEYSLSNGADAYTDVMEEGMAIFVLPQSLSSQRVSEGGDAPTAMVRIRRKYQISEDSELAEVIYESQKMIIPAATGSTTGCWDVGQHIQLSFDFDIGKLSEYDTPLTISSEVLDWTPVEVTVDVHRNLYVYSSNETIAVEESTDQTDIDAGYQYYGDFQICTNYDYNLRVPHHREELGGTITSSRGFLFCSDDFSLITNNNVGEFVANNSTYQIFVPTLLSGSDKIYYASATSYDAEGAVSTTNFDSYTGSYIYEYSSGYNTDNTDRSVIGNKSEIVYGSNGYAYIKNETTGLYRLLYLDPNNDNALTAFNYTDTYDAYTGTYTDDYHEIVLTNFGGTDAEGRTTVNYIVEISDDYSFNFSVTRSTRTLEGLYTSTAISGDDNSYGVNKEGDDAVYTLRLSVNPEHLLDSDTGTFNDIIGVEMISNGGGMITSLFPVELKNDNGVITD